MEKEKNKIIILSIIAVIILITIIILTAIFLNLKKEENIVNDLQNNTVNSNTNNVVNNTVENIVDVNNTAQNNAIVNNVNEINNEENNTTIEDPKQEIDKSTIQKQVDSKESAMEIVKENWGEDSNVYFSFDGVSDGKYYISVRDKETHTLRTYIVNSDDGSFVIE